MEIDGTLDRRRLFDDAAAVWHMGSPNADTIPLVVHGAVRLGVELAGEERVASLARGGDGMVAEFDGGYLALPAEGENAVDVSGPAMSLCLRARAAHGAWNVPIVGKYGALSEASFVLGHVSDDAPEGGCREGVLHENRIEFMWGGSLPNEAVKWLSGYPFNTPELVQEACEGVLRVQAPLAGAQAGEWHDVIVRFTGPKLQLFLDGVLVDEEYPIGTLRAGTAPFLIGAASVRDAIVGGFRGQIDHVALWRRSLSDAEIAALSGGAETAALREAEILGSRRRVSLDWRPRGHNKKVGDCFPYFDGERLHVFYLTIRRKSHRKWQGGHGGLQVEHMVTRDLRHWDFLPMGIEIGDQWEGWHGTGSCVLHEGTYYLFFPTLSCMPDSHPGGIQLATSADGVRFDKQAPRPLLEGGDAEVFRDADGRFNLLTYIEKRDADHTELTHFVSDDLRVWRRREEPFLIGEERDNHLYCPNYFEWNGWYYVVAGCRSTIWKSRCPFGPWQVQHPCTPDSSFVPKSAAFLGDRRILIGWIPDSRGSWGGDIVLRELTQDREGNLGVQFPPELLPPLGESLSLAVEPATASAVVRSDSVELNAKESPQAAVMRDVPNDVYLTMTVDPGSGVGRFGVRLRATDDTHGGCGLCFEPDARRVRLETPCEGAGPASVTELNEVDNIATPFLLEILAHRGLIHVCIGRRRALTIRDASDGSRLVFYAEGSAVVYSDTRVVPLAAQ